MEGGVVAVVGVPVPVSSPGVGLSVAAGLVEAGADLDLLTAAVGLLASVLPPGVPGVGPSLADPIAPTAVQTALTAEGDGPVGFLVAAIPGLEGVDLDGLVDGDLNPAVGVAAGDGRSNGEGVCGLLAEEVVLALRPIELLPRSRLELGHQSDYLALQRS